MRGLVQKALILAVVGSGFLAAPAMAQNREKAWELNPYAGVMLFSKVDGENILEDTWDVGFRFGYHWTKRHMVEFGFFGAATEDGEDLGLDIDLLGGQINYNYNFFLARRDKIVAFVTAGAGPLNISSFGFVSDPELVGDTVVFSYNYGAGIRFFGGPRTGFRIDIRQVNFSDEGVDVKYLETAIGLSIVLGGA